MLTEGNGGVAEEAPSPRRARAALWGAAAAIGAAALWAGISVAFPRLVFHLQPALVGLAAGWGWRRGLAARGGAADLASVAILTALVVPVAAAVIRGGGGGLDPVGVVGLVGAAGAAGGAWILRRWPIPAATGRLGHRQRRSPTVQEAEEEPWQ